MAAVMSGPGPDLKSIPFFRNGTLFLFLALAGFFFGGMFLLVGLISDSSASDSLFLGTCVPITFIPASALLVLGLVLRQRGRRLEKFAQLLRAYRRIGVETLAHKLGVTEFAAEQRIVECIGRGLVDGTFDRHTGEFVTAEALAEAQQHAAQRAAHRPRAHAAMRRVEKCPACGAPLEQPARVGQVLKCSYCDSLLEL